MKKELDELIADAEKQIEALLKDETAQGRELRHWFLGVKKGLEFASVFVQEVS